MLTDAMEVHFIEHNKFLNADHDLKDPLHRWLLFLDEKLPDSVLKELMEMDPVIKRAEERLEWLSSDEETQRLYEAREHSIIERNSLISDGEAKGKTEVVLNMLRKGLDPLLISELTGFSIEEIKRLKNTQG